MAASGGLQKLIPSPLEPPDAHLEPFATSRSSFGALWSLQNAIMEPILIILELLGVSKSLCSSSGCTERVLCAYFRPKETLGP